MGRNAQAEPRGIIVGLEFATAVDGLSDEQITHIAMCANELATNALKHAFEEGAKGRITMAVRRCDAGQLAIILDYDGLPLPTGQRQRSDGTGPDLVRGLLRSFNGVLIPPKDGSKQFEMRVPVRQEMAA